MREAKQQRRHVVLVRDRLFIDGEQYIPPENRPVNVDNVWNTPPHVPVWWNLWVYFHNFQTEIDIDQWKQDCFSYYDTASLAPYFLDRECVSARVRSLEDKVTNFRKTLTECENSCQGVSNLFDQADSQIKHNTRNICPASPKTVDVPEFNIVVNL
jgi:hypothetical protein